MKDPRCSYDGCKSLLMAYKEMWCSKYRRTLGGDSGFATKCWECLNDEWKEENPKQVDELDFVSNVEAIACLTVLKDATVKCKYGSGFKCPAEDNYDCVKCKTIKMAIKALAEDGKNNS